MPRAANNATSKKLLVNVASSKFVFEDYENLDTSPYYQLLRLPRAVQDLLPAKYQQDLEEYRQAKAKAKIVLHDCRKPLPYADETVDHIVSSHFLEHVYPDECQAIVHDYFRALKPGGTLHVIVPDLKMYIDEYLKMYAQKDANAANWFVKHTILSRPTRGSWRYRLLEMTGLFGLQHRWMYDQLAMEAVVKAAGFKLITRKDVPSAAYSATEPYVHVYARKA